MDKLGVLSLIHHFNFLSIKHSLQPIGSLRIPFSEALSDNFNNHPAEVTSQICLMMTRDQSVEQEQQTQKHTAKNT